MPDSCADCDGPYVEHCHDLLAKAQPCHAPCDAMTMAMAKRDWKYMYCSGPRVEECIIYRRSRLIIVELQIRPGRPARRACDRQHCSSNLRLYSWCRTTVAATALHQCRHCDLQLCIVDCESNDMRDSSQCIARAHGPSFHHPSTHRGL